MSESPLPPAPAPRFGVIVLTTFGGSTLLAIALLYQYAFDFDCRANLSREFCAALSLAVPRGMSVAALVATLLALRAGLRDRIVAAVRPGIPPFWPGLTAVGLLLILSPWLWFRAESTLLPAPVMAAFWSGGLLAALTGLTFSAFSPRALGVALASGGRELGIALLAGLFLPDLALATQGLWNLEALSHLTFAAVIQTLTLLGQEVTSDPATRLIGIGDFEVLVGKQCSGVEGFALITVFTGFFLWLFRDRLDPGRASVLLPLGLVLSWVLNILRISGLLLIGHYQSPDLAMNGFHSNAGWLMFLALALGLAVASQHVTWLRRADAPITPAPSGPRTLAPSDESTGLILPFAVFMASAALAPALAQVPALLYPLRVVATGAALAFCGGFLWRQTWRPDVPAISGGLICGGFWVATAPSATTSDLILLQTLSTLSPLVLVLWTASRVVGTTVLVPIVEEAFFRGYLLRRIPGRSPWARGLAIVVSALLFGLLHERMLAAFLAGLLFGIIYLRRRALSDAIQCHAAANAVIAVAALSRGAWHLI